jgi:hypothetical protein
VANKSAEDSLARPNPLPSILLQRSTSTSGPPFIRPRQISATSSASKHTSYLELHFSQSTGRLAGAKASAFTLDKSRILSRLRYEERTFHVFSQLLAGPGIRLEDALEYSMLSASGAFHPPGLFGSDHSQVSSSDPLPFGKRLRRCKR